MPSVSELTGKVYMYFEEGWECRIPHHRLSALTYGSMNEIEAHPDQKQKFVTYVETFKVEFATLLQKGEYAQCEALIKKLTVDVRNIDKELFSGLSLEVDTLIHWLSMLSMPLQLIQMKKHCQ